MKQIVFFGMRGQFSIPPLDALIRAGHPVGAVIVPAAQPHDSPRQLTPDPIASEVPLVNPYLAPNIIHTGWANDIPVWEVGRQPTELLAQLQPDVMVVACFPYRLPPDVLQIPTFGCLNVHPSLLPAYRGPEPRFWMAYHGETRGGVTVHHLDADFDTGDIVMQAGFSWAEGASGQAIACQSACLGGELLLESLACLESLGQLPRYPQSEEGSSYYPNPTAAETIISTAWTAQRAFTFIRAAADWSLTVQLDDTSVTVNQAISYDPAGQLGRGYVVAGKLWRIQFASGVLVVLAD